MDTVHQTCYSSLMELPISSNPATIKGLVIGFAAAADTDPDAFLDLLRDHGLRFKDDDAEDLFNAFLTYTELQAGADPHVYIDEAFNGTSTELRELLVERYYNEVHILTNRIGAPA